MKSKLELCNVLPIVFAAIVFFITSIFLTYGASCAEPVSVKVGVYENHPKIFTNQNSRVSGFWPELLENIAQKENWKVEYIQGTWSEGLARLEAEEIDIMPDVAFTEKRNEVYIFSKDPVLMSWSRLYVHKDNTTIQSIQELNNKKIAALKNSVNLEGAGGFRELVDNFYIDCTFIQFDDYREVFQAVADKRVDAGITNRNFGNTNAQLYGVKKTPILFQPISVKFAFPRNSHRTPLFVERINFHMTAMQEDGKSPYYQILTKYFETEIAEKKVEVFPDWLKTVLQVLAVLLLLFIVVIIATRFQVQRKTRKIREMNKALRLSEEKYRILADESPDFRYRADMKGIVVYASKAIHKFCGYTVDEFVGMSMAGVYVNPEDRETFLAILQNNGYVDGFAAQLKRKDGSVWWAASNAKFYKDRNGSILGVDGVIRDITEQKENEAAIRKSEEQWNRTFNAFPDIVTLQDTDLRIIKANQAARNFLDLPYDGIVGRACHELFHGCSEPCQGCPLLEIRESFSLCSGEMYHEKLKKTFFVSGSPIWNEDAEIEYIVHVAKDITQIKQLEDQLFQSQKMEAIGTMAGGIAHDFNNILAAMIGYAEFIQMDVPEESKIGKYAAEVLKAGSRATDLVKQILTFSRQRTGEKQLVNPVSIVKDTMKMLYATMPATVTIQEDIDPDCGSIIADPTIIHQIVINLCTNGMQAMAEQKGTLLVGLHCQEFSGASFSEKQAGVHGSFVVLTVEDSGCGMDQSMIDRIFEPYFTTKEIGRGTGLGLAIVHGVVEECKGFVEVESSIDEGTVFSVYLPLVEEKTAQKVVAEQKVSKEKKSGDARILLVDDELFLVKINKKRLIRQGYVVTGCTDSSEALEIIRKQPDSIDLLITDQTMPGITGVELAKAVMGIRPSLPIILCTGHSDVVSEEEALRLGIKRYIYKPVRGDELLTAVSEVLVEVAPGKSHDFS